MKALALISGGLDSALAAYLIKSQGVEVIGMSFDTKFTSPKVERLAESLNIPIKLIDISEEFLAVLRSPKHGYGKNINPCIDCHTFMLKKCKEMLKKEKASFVITGEVLGQRPMSQRKDALRIVEKDCGLEGLLLRPLSAKLLPETIPEKEGWVNREKLLEIQGKGRKEQLRLAKEINLEGHGTPAGGCLLTDPSFSKRLGDLMKNKEDFDVSDIQLLKTGRHFRLDAQTKLVLGRDEKDNLILRELKQKKDIFLAPPLEVAGPDAILRSSELTDENFELAKRIFVYYYKKHEGKEFKIEVEKSGMKEVHSLSSAADKRIVEELIIK